MACHVSTCMAMEKDIFGMWELFIQVGSSKKEKEGKKKKRERKERKIGKEKRERMRRKERRRKGKRCSDGRNSLDQEVKSVYFTRVALQEVGFLLLRLISRLGAV